MNPFSQVLLRGQPLRIDWLRNHDSVCPCIDRVYITLILSIFSFNGVNPIIQFVAQTYQTGVKLTQKQMAFLEQRFPRLEGLEKWFVLITALAAIQNV